MSGAGVLGIAALRDELRALSEQQHVAEEARREAAEAAERERRQREFDRHAAETLYWRAAHFCAEDEGSARSQLRVDEAQGWRYMRALARREATQIAEARRQEVVADEHAYRRGIAVASDAVYRRVKMSLAEMDDGGADAAARARAAADAAAVRRAAALRELSADQWDGFYAPAYGERPAPGSGPVRQDIWDLHRLHEELGELERLDGEVEAVRAAERGGRGAVCAEERRGFRGVEEALVDALAACVDDGVLAAHAALVHARRAAGDARFDQPGMPGTLLRWDEQRLDPGDGSPHERGHFLFVYGDDKGERVWNAAATAPPGDGCRRV